MRRLGPTLALLSLLAACQCGEDRTGTVRPEIEAEPASLDFGTTAPSIPVERTVTLKNTGRARLTLGEVIVAGDSAPSFSADPPASSQIEPGGSLNVRVVYSPPDEGIHAARLVVRSDASNTSELLVMLGGHAIPGDPCARVACNNPPPCFTGGVCVGGSCDYQPDEGASCTDGDACTTGDVCGASGACAGVAVSCNTPPPPTCLDPQTQRGYDSVGTCGEGGACSYAPHDASCALGCDSDTGMCRSSCPSGQHLCESQCVSNTSVASCGDSCSPCPVPADGSATCDGTACGFTCNTGYKVCGSGCCLDVQTFVQQAYLKASNTGIGDFLGYRVALSADGSTLAVGARSEESNATGVNGNQADNSAEDSGAVYVFTRANGAWSQQAYIKASNTGRGDQFGFDVALSADGSTLAVGAYLEDSNATGVNGNQADNSASDSGTAYVFTRANGTWSQQAYLKASNTGTGDAFGVSVALSADGGTLAVGAPAENSNATGVNGNQADNSAYGSGAVYVFARVSGTWSQQAYLKASNAGAGGFGIDAELSGDGSTLAIGAPGDKSNATGVNGNQADNSAGYSGAVYVFTRSGSSWSQQAYVKASNTGVEDGFGESVALSADGNTLAVGADGEDSNATGVNGDQADNSATQSGAVYVFTRTGNTWTQQAYLKASNTESGDLFGSRVALSADGSTLAVGAEEDSNATGVNGNQADNSAPDSYAVYLFTRAIGSWTQQAYIKASNTDAGDGFGYPALSADGRTLAVGALGEDSNATGVNGNQADNSASGSGAVYVFALE